MELLFVVVGMGVMIPLIVWAKRRSDAAQERTNRAWAEAASVLGAQHTPAGGSWYSPTPRRIDASIDGMRVAIDHHDVNSGENTTTTYTRVVTHTRAPSDFKLRVYRAGAFSEIARAVGFQDIEVGDPHFDPAFVVKSNDPEAARLWLSSVVRNHVVAAQPCHFEIKHGRTTVERAELVDDAGSLVAMAQAAAAFSDGRHRLMKTWRTLGKRHGGKVRRQDDRWALLELEVEGVPMVVDTRRLRDRHFTFVTGRARGARLSPFVLANDAHLHQSNLPRAVASDLPEGYALWAIEPPAAFAQLTQGVRGLIDELAPAKVRVDADTVVVMWPGIATQAKEMDRALSLCAALANGPSRAPYR